MISLSKKEAETIDFLFRNFRERYTMRQISFKLKTSPAGMHKLLKKLEKNNILISEKLGSGLFYEINLHNKSARNLAAFVLTHEEKHYPKELDELENKADFCILSGKDLLIGNLKEVYGVEDIAKKHNLNLTLYSQEEFKELAKKKNKKLLETIKNGIIVFGEHLLINAVKDV